MRVWFTADTHFGHGNIIKYCVRPFKGVEDMEKVLVKRWNERVKNGDTVIFLGDFMFKRGKGVGQSEGSMNDFNHYKDQLNGDIVFIRGNHDNNNTVDTKIENLVLQFGKSLIFCTHNPSDYNWDYPINLIGHIHTHWKISRNVTDRGRDVFLVNVGVDVWNFYPVKIEEILRLIEKFKRDNCKYLLKK